MLYSLLHNEITQDYYLRSNDTEIIYKQLPKKIYGCVFRYKNYNIVTINSNISIFKQKKTILHEFAHIELNHLENKRKLLEFKIEDIEDQADEYIKNLLKK